MADSLGAALTARTDLDKYGSAKRTLFALQLSFGLEDIESVASTALTDGPDDKSCDLVYVDRDNEVIVIAQGYESEKPDTKRQAPLSKAADLHQAINWLMGGTEESIPERLKAAHREVHEALKDGVISQVQIWFVHNCPGSKQVVEELDACARAARTLIQGNHGQVPAPDVTAIEYSIEHLADIFEGSATPILVGDTFSFDSVDAFEENGDNWKAVALSIPALWLHDLFSTHEERVFSANIRGYLGSQKAKSNINNGIKETVETRPQKFWPFNNGITALVHDFDLDRERKTLTVTGVAIVNGAQTTGAIGSVDRAKIGSGKVMARFIRCQDTETVQEIVRFNNRQNPTQASDFRSNDRIQDRLVREFGTLGVVGYNGGRRGGSSDAIRRPADNRSPQPLPHRRSPPSIVTPALPIMKRARYGSPIRPTADFSRSAPLRTTFSSRTRCCEP